MKIFKDEPTLAFYLFVVLLLIGAFVIRHLPQIVNLLLRAGG